MTSKKSGFWRLCFSLLPGAGEMYMGFFKMGISLMGLFFGIFFLAATLPFDVLMLVNVVIWFYSFFNVHNMASLPDEEFYAIEDHYIFHFTQFSFQGNVRIVAAALIFTGIVMTWNGMLDLLYDYMPEAVYRCIRHISYDLPKILVGIAIIALGAAMIRGKKESLKQLDGEAEHEQS
ncbi:MAG: hypothetical protein HFJ04_13175 [Lachnospiraceae bacterium]|nr:hypothetical protein [Lachnospiraceae bacterium]